MNEYIFVVFFHNKKTFNVRAEFINIHEKCEYKAFNNCVSKAFKKIRQDEGLWKIELIEIE